MPLMTYFQCKPIPSKARNDFDLWKHSGNIVYGAIMGGVNVILIVSQPTLKDNDFMRLAYFNRQGGIHPRIRDTLGRR